MLFPSPSSLAVAATASMFAALILRRRMRVRAALSVWSRVAAARLKNAPPHHVRVAITGASSGIGRACVDLLSKYPCIDVVLMGRRPDSTIPAHRSHSIAVDLADSNQVAAAASALAGKWYSDSNATSPPPPPGLDIVINNAGVFSGHTSGLIWAINTHAPVLISHAITEAWIAASSRPHARSLRVVQVGSRLEKSSQLGRDNARQIEQQAMCSGNNKIGVTSGQAYSDSKRALLLYTAHIADAYEALAPRMTFAVVTPGMVDTGLGKKSVPLLLWLALKPLRYVMMKHAQEAAADILCAAFTEDNGVYMADSGRVIERFRETRDASAGAEVASIVQQHFAAASVSKDGEWA